jgi:protein-S-isoprenylcysteine O-methyltransferase Ste14
MRSLLWAALLPGVVSVFVPWAFFGADPTTFDPSSLRHALGAIVMAIGVALTVVCIADFARRGRGTLSPLDPPRFLVVNGLYRYVRNPMYLGVATLGIGELMVWPSRGLAIWWLSWFFWVNVFVIAVEEPSLRRQFGSSYRDYANSVGRWIPRPRPYTMGS